MAKPKKPKAKKPNLRTPGLDPLSAWSMPQIQSWAQKQARAAINPILTDIDRQQQNNTANITGFSEALARTLAPLGARVGDAYQTSAGMGDAFGSGFQDGLKLLEQQGSTEGGQQVAGALAGLTSSLGGIASRALGQEGAAQQTLANTYALAPANMGQQYLREAQGRFDAQRQQVRDKVPDSVQQIIQSLLDREIQKAGLRANEQALGLDKAKFEEGKRQFDESLDFDKQKFQSDARYRNKVLRAQEEERTAALKGEKKERNERKNAAVDAATMDVASWVEERLAPQYADMVIGSEKKIAKVVQKYKEVPKYPNRKDGPTKRVPDGYEVWYFTPNGTLTNVPDEAAEEPVYEKQPVSAPAYYQLRKDVLAQLRNGLRRFGIKPGRYELLADEILSRWYDVDQENLSTVGWGRADKGFDYTSALDTGYP